MRHISYTYQNWKPTHWAIVDISTWIITCTQNFSIEEKEKLSARVHTPKNPYPVVYPKIYTEVFSLPKITDTECFRILDEYVAPMCETVVWVKYISDEIVACASKISSAFVKTLDYKTHPILQQISTHLSHPYRHECLFQTRMPDYSKVLQWFLFNFWVRLSSDTRARIASMYKDSDTVSSYLDKKTFQFVTPLHGHPSSLLIDHAVPSDQWDENLAVQVEYEIYTSEWKRLVNSRSEIDPSVSSEFSFTYTYPYFLKGKELHVFKQDDWLWLHTSSELDWLCNPHSVIPLSKKYATLNTYLWYGDVSSFAQADVSVDISPEDRKKLDTLLAEAPLTLLVDDQEPFRSTSPKDLIYAYLNQYFSLPVT